MDEVTEMKPSPAKFGIVIGLLIMGGLLIVFLMPPLHSARDQARRANCLSNVRALGLGFAMYADNYQGRCPVYKPRTLIGSFLLMSNTAGSPKVLICSCDSRPGVRAANNFGTLTTRNISYS